MSLNLRIAKLESTSGTTGNCELIKIANIRHRVSLMSDEELEAELKLLHDKISSDNTEQQPSKPIACIRITDEDRRILDMSNDDLIRELAELRARRNI